MEIPDDLTPWVDKVRQREYGKRIIENLQAEERLEPGVEAEFWKRLRTRHKCTCQRTTVASPDDYIMLIEKAVEETAKQSTLFLQGGAARHNEKRLGRLEPVNGECFERAFLEKLGLHEGNETGLAAALEDPHVKIEQKQVGRIGRIAWASFPTEIAPHKRRLKKALEVLGMLLPQKTPPYVYWEYDYSSEPTFCPTVLDAGVCQFFQPTPRAASTGKTRPTDEGLKGVREVVHPSKAVRILRRKVLYYRP